MLTNHADCRSPRQPNWTGPSGPASELSRPDSCRPEARLCCQRRRQGRQRQGRRRQAVQRQGGQRGSATVELAVLFPAFLALVFGGVQVAEWFHVRSLCLAAADVGVEAGRRAGAGSADAGRAASGFLARAGTGTAEDPTVSTAGSTASQVRVEVSATAPRVLPLPGLSMRVTQSAQGVRERFTVPGRAVP